MKQHHLQDKHYSHCSPAVFFTVTPCDECSFCVRLYATCNEHTIPTMNDIQCQEKCLLDLNARKKWSAKYPGACEFSIISSVNLINSCMYKFTNKFLTNVGRLFQIINDPATS